MQRLFLTLICLLLLSACGYQSGVVQKSELGYIQLTGNWKNTQVSIDKADPFELKYLSDPNDPDATQSKPTLKYGLKPGKHIVKASRDGKLLVNRIILVTSQQTTEVAIP